jgi:hypothetical protein
MIKLLLVLLLFNISIKSDIINLKSNLINELKNELNYLGPTNITIPDILIHIKDNNLLRFDEIVQNIHYKIPIIYNYNIETYINVDNSNIDDINKIKNDINKLHINYGNLSNIIYNEFLNSLNNDVFNFNTNYKLNRFTNLKEYMLKICKINIPNRNVNEWLIKKINNLKYEYNDNNDFKKLHYQLLFNIKYHIIIKLKQELYNINNYIIIDDLLIENNEYIKKRINLLLEIKKYE